MMNSKIIANGIVRAVGMLVLAVLILFFIYKIQTLGKTAAPKSPIRPA